MLGAYFWREINGLKAALIEERAALNEEATSLHRRINSLAHDVSLNYAKNSDVERIERKIDAMHQSMTDRIDSLQTTVITAITSSMNKK